MGHAWLDSLSEDWVSQNGSDTSQCAPAESTELSRRPNETVSSSKSSPSRSPGSVRHFQSVSPVNSSNILSERSPNEINMFGSRLGLSKLSRELKVHDRGNLSPRSEPASAAGSVIHNTIERRSVSTSPIKGGTPEWRRRIVEGGLGFGEQRDLFSPTRLGLENIFQPPQAPAAVEASVAEDGAKGQQSEEREETRQAFEKPEVLEGVGQEAQYDDELRHDTTIPSSPPVSRQLSQQLYDVSYESVGGCAAPELPQQPRRFLSQTEDLSDLPKFEEADHSVQSAQSAGIDESVHQRSPPTVDAPVFAAAEGSQAHIPMKPGSRFTSGQSVLRNESFSAILISPERNDGNGTIFGEVELPPGELKRRLENLRWNQVALTDKAGEIAANEESANVSGKSLNAEDSAEYEKMGGFINFKRGGRSSDGSFRNRLLSPSLEADTSEMLPEESLQASTPKQFPTIRTERATLERQHTPILPRVPNPSPAKMADGSQALFTASGSPLKLFGPYDTFTNQTLMRRISQFEDQMSNGSLLSAEHSAYHNEDEPSRLELASIIAGSPQRLRMETTQASRQSSAQFGIGDLDGYSFSEVFSDQAEAAAEAQKSPFDKVPKLPFYVPPESEGGLRVHRQRLSGTTNPSRPLPSRPSAAKLISTEPAAAPTSPETPRRFFESGSEKRLRASPLKDSTPKRRRTLHKSDIAFGKEPPQLALTSVHTSHLNIQSVVGRTRRDAREGDEYQSADPEVLANRLIRWPHAPTSSRRSSENQNQSSVDADGREGDPHGDSGGNENWEGSADSSHVAPAVGGHDESDRKPSIRTEDFMNEANKIMAMLRSRGGGIQSGLASVEESEMETPVLAEQSDGSDGSFQESTKEPFSRPPSREGKPVLRVTRVQDDPEVAARLRKYAERSDLDDLVSSTTRSINLVQDAILAEQEAEQAVQDSIGSLRGGIRADDSEFISDPPNVRISEDPTRTGRSRSLSAQSSLGDGITSQMSLSTSSGFSSGRSSRGSESRKTIAPETVSHLIPDQVGNMMLDRNNNIWIKRRNGSSSQFSGNIQPSECSEEDPFADIPDLSVDVTMELHNLRPVLLPAAQEAARVPCQSPTKRSGPTLATKSDVPTLAADVPPEPPMPADAEADEATPQDKDEGAVEHEISIDEGRVPHGSLLKKRHLAISFSSPIASIISDEADGALRPGGADEHTQGVADDVSITPVQRGRHPAISVKFNHAETTPSRPQSTSGGPSRRFSLAGRAFVSRPVSRIEEREEDSTDRRLDVPSIHIQPELSAASDHSTVFQVAAGPEAGTPSGRRSNISVLLATPGERTLGGMSARGDDEEVMAQYVGMMSLSPMSEFTIHHDRSLALEASYVRGARHLVTGDESTAVMSQSLRSLVKRLAEVQPSEPFWEDLEELDVQNKSLESLHKLDHFCPQLVTLDVAGNSLRNLNGVPVSVRHLKAVGNQLSELTSWVSLANLQYLDISNNAIKTLAGLKNLVHLRGLKADNCSLTDLEGIKYHDALQTLRARGNEIRAVSFAGTRLQKLVELDLEDNQVASVTSLGQLGSLAVLNLRRNALGRFTADANGALPHVRTLNLSDNRLEVLDVRGLTSLRTLHADRNRLTGVRGFSRTPRLDSVSLREQSLASSQQLDLSSLYQAYEVRKLYLSGNYLESFDPPVDFLNLQLLELANCGLTSLPAEFGVAAPNLRKLNLNFNGMTDLRCLAGIPRLKKLQAAGNRLSHAYTAIQVLAGFPHLVEADLRDNPLSQGFYPPPVQVVVSGGMGSHRASSGSHDHDQDHDHDHDNHVGSSTTTEPFSLPYADELQDQAYCRRLDLATGMRRRVYEQVVGEACKKLKHLDGLNVRRDLGAVRDAVWDALSAKGIVGVRVGSAGAESSGEKETTDGSRWGAEDTFA